MSISEKLPGMRPGSTVRNFGVGIAYFFLVMMVLGAVGGDEVEGDDGDSTSDATADEEEEAATAEANDESEETDESGEADNVENEIEEEVGAQLTADDVEVVLASNGLDVAVSETGDGVLMEYYDTVESEQELAENLGGIAGAHAAWYEDDPSIGGLTIDMYNAQTGEYAGTTSPDESLTRAYVSDEITAQEYALEILAGLESSR